MKPEKIERRPSDEERLEALRALFPEAVSDGALDVSKLSEIIRISGGGARSGPGR